MSIEFYESQIEELLVCLEDVKALSDEEVQIKYNCDSKEEFTQYLLNDIEMYEKVYKEALQEKEDQEDCERRYGLDPAFYSWKEFNSMFI